MHAALHSAISLYCLAVWIQQLSSPRSCHCYCCITWFDRCKYGTCSYFSHWCSVCVNLWSIRSRLTTYTLTARRTGTVFSNLAREVSSWEQLLNPVSNDVHSVSLKNQHVHFLREGAVRVSSSVFKATRPSASALIIHCMTQMLPCILKSTLACFKTLRLVLPLLDLGRLILCKHDQVCNSLIIFLTIYSSSRSSCVTYLLWRLASYNFRAAAALLQCTTHICLVASHSCFSTAAIASQISSARWWYASATSVALAFGATY